MAELGIDSLVFASYEEVRPRGCRAAGAAQGGCLPCTTHTHTHTHTHTQAKETHGSKKFHKFFLVDAAGGRHLAATGEDTGDAHYNYTSSKPFNKYGAVSCHNRREVLLW